MTKLQELEFAMYSYVLAHGDIPNKVVMHPDTFISLKKEVTFFDLRPTQVSAKNEIYGCTIVRSTDIDRDTFDLYRA
jgi:hypothetical protein